MSRRTTNGRWSLLRAVAVVSRLTATVGYNVASVVLAVGLGARVGGLPDVATLWLAGGYAAATMFAKLGASVADAIHDRSVDAANPEKTVIASAVDRLGQRRASRLLAGYVLVALVLYGAVAVTLGWWALAAGGAVVGLGLAYSYPPRFKERGIWNHVVTTGVDVGLLVLPVAVVVAGGIAPAIVVGAAVVACYGVGYHLLHQAADVYYDRQAGVETFATTVGVADTVAVAAVATGAAAGLSFALGYVVAGTVLVGVTVFYGTVYDSVRGASPESASRALAARFSIAWVATIANGAFAASVWRHGFGLF
ncbi:MAG: UbiA family prenyltransferase [Halolamina sp.]